MVISSLKVTSTNGGKKDWEREKKKKSHGGGIYHTDLGGSRLRTYFGRG